jgi:hypothetical protein
MIPGVFANPMPMKFDYYDCVYVAEDSKWKMWADMLPQFTIPPVTIHIPKQLHHIYFTH